MKFKFYFTKIDKIIVDFISKYQNQIFFISATILALWLRNTFRGFYSGDFVLHFLPWCEYLESHGGFLGIKTLESDYPVAYQYILAFLTYLPASYIAKIKVVSVIFDIISAIFVFLFVKKIGSYSKKSAVPYLAYAVTLFVPTIVMNSAVWGQSDIIYTTFILISLYCFSEEKYSQAFIWYGLALSFKLQAIFVLPMFLLLYLKTKKFSILNFLLIPMVNFLVYMPALLLGKPIAQIYAAYSTQVGEFSQTVLNFGNIYNLLPNDFELFYRAGLILTFVILGIVYFCILAKETFMIDAKSLVETALVSVMICTYFLPAMHERYMFVADVLGVIYLFTHKDKFYIPILIWFINANGYMPVLFGIDPWLDFKYLALIYVVVLWLILKNMFSVPNKKNPNNAH